MTSNNGGQMYPVVSTVLVALATVLVNIRIAVQITNSALRWDDYFICLSLVLLYSVLGQPIIWTHDGGLGKHGHELTTEEDINFHKSLFVNEILYTLLNFFIKASILLLYQRILNTPRLILPRLVIFGLVLAWSIVVFITVLFQCRPMPLNWVKAKPGTCLDENIFLLGNAAFNILIDLILLILPIPLIVQLQVSLTQKLSTLGLLLLGAFACIRSVMRVKSLHISETEDKSYYAMQAATWTITEPWVAIICVCLPIVFPFLRSQCSLLSWDKEYAVGPAFTKHHRTERESSPLARPDNEGWDHGRLIDEYALMEARKSSRAWRDHIILALSAGAFFWALSVRFFWIACEVLSG